MFFFKFKKYRYIPSYETKTSSKIESLTDKYEDLFLRYIQDKNLLSKEEHDVLLIEGVQEISKYVINGLFYQIMTANNSNKILEKKAEVLLNIAKKQYGHDNFKDYLEEELMILSEDIIYESIGMIKSDKKNIFKKDSENSNFISFIKKRLFFSFLKFLEKNVTNFNNIKLFFENYDDSEEKEQEIDFLLKESKLSESLPKETLFRIKESLLKNDIDVDLMPYLEFLAAFKENTKE